MWKQLSRLCLVGLLFSLLLSSSGCDLDQAELTAEQIKALADGAAPYVPEKHTYIPIAISVASTAALALIRIVQERRQTQLMKDAIKAKSKHLDLLMQPTDNPGTKTESPIKTGLRKLKNVSTNKVYDDLSRFDAVRKGYV